MARGVNPTQPEHPAPRGHKVSLSVLGLALIATPTLWGVRLIAKFAIAEYVCFPGDERRLALPHGDGWVWPTLLVIDLLTIASAAAAAAISYRDWQASHDEHAAAKGSLVQVGEGRTRFLSLWGIMIGVGFLIAVLFDLVALWAVPVCG